MKTSKTAVAVSTVQGKIASIIGYSLSIIVFLALLGFIIELAEDGTSDLAGIIFVIFLAGCGVLFILKGIQIKKRIKRFRKYVSLISIQNMTSLNDLAVNTEKSAAFVKEDLQKMIQKKFFAHAVINIQTNEIIIQGVNNNRPLVQTRGAVCRNCGANGRVTSGQINECDYCGSILE